MKGAQLIPDRARGARGGRIGVNTTETKRNQKASNHTESQGFLGRGVYSGARGREFESPRSDQFNQ